MATIGVCGPSGVGKGTLMGMLLADYPDTFATFDSAATSDGRDFLVVVDFARAKQIKTIGDRRAHFIFIAPPSVADLEARLRARATESDAAIRKRVDSARADLAAKDDCPALFDAVIVNGELTSCYRELKAAVAELTHLRLSAALLRKGLDGLGNTADGTGLAFTRLHLGGAQVHLRTWREGPVGVGGVESRWGLL